MVGQSSSVFLVCAAVMKLESSGLALKGVNMGVAMESVVSGLKRLDYEGFVRECHCEYGVVKSGAETCVVFVQGEGAHTSITNVIELLASLVMGKDGVGLDPKKVRFFEYYPNAMKSMITWQEVVFKDCSAVWRDGVIGKVLGKLMGKQPTWVFGNPRWVWLDGRDVPAAVRSTVEAGEVVGVVANDDGQKAAEPKAA